MSKAQSTLAFPSRKSATPAARKPVTRKQQSASAKKSPAPALTTAVVNKQLVSTPQKADADEDVQLTHTRSSPRSEPIHRTTSSHERTKHARDSLLPGTWTDASDNEILLRKFDLEYKYGPCGGLSRKARWQRAHAMHLDPPQHVWDILEQMDDEDDEARVEGGGGVEVDESERKKRRKKYDIDSHSIFENLTSRVLEAEGRGPP